MSKTAKKQTKPLDDFRKFEIPSGQLKKIKGGDGGDLIVIEDVSEG